MGVLSRFEAILEETSKESRMDTMVRELNSSRYVLSSTMMHTMIEQSMSVGEMMMVAIHLMKSNPYEAAILLVRMGEQLGNERCCEDAKKDEEAVSYP